MKLLRTSGAALLAGGAALWCACGEAPKPVDSGAGAGSLLPPGHPTPGGGTPAQGPVANETRLAGTLTLEGPGFELPATTIFVNVRPTGQKGPWLSRKYTMDSPSIAGEAGGPRRLDFSLRSADTQFETFNMNGLHDAPEGIELELHVCVKATGFVDGATLCEAVAPFTKGKQDYALTLTAP